MDSILPSRKFILHDHDFCVKSHLSALPRAVKTWNVFCAFVEQLLNTSINVRKTLNRMFRYSHGLFCSTSKLFSFS